MHAFPASAQTGSDSNRTRSDGPQAQSELTGSPTNSNPVSPNTGTNTATPNTSSQPQFNPAPNSPAPNNPAPKKAAILIDINKAKQKMTVFIDGVQKYEWPVSTGRAGYSTPSGTYTATSMNEMWYSKQWDNSPMPHSIFFIKDGHAIHGSYEVKNLGKPVSHGCVRIAPENATTLYALVKANGLENTQVVLNGVTPGGEFKYARDQGPPGWGYFEQPYGAPYYNGPRGYYGWPSGYSRW
jgi:lipoprotein-anchoring transpeptidase ErfK/SrfK